MITIANPIYDSVFKFLMEDERVARTILSALLKMDITKVEMRPHEYSNSQRDALSMFRIDFAATVRQSDGSEKIILIEVQKTWIETETLRFRQYLGVQYQRKENIQPGSKEGFAIPMVAVYILGHKVGDIEEPVIYVEHEAYDYNRNLVVRGLPNAFVDSLTHDSIIVQIPRLHGKINNRLDKVLSVFDQARQTPQTEHLLNYDDSTCQDDSDMQPILHRLLMAASDADTRQDMNVEDEYYSVIERRDTEILLNARKIAKQNVQINQQNVQINQQKRTIDEQKSQIDEQKSQIDEQKSQIGRQKSQIDEQKSQIDEQKSQIDEQKSQIDEQKSQIDEQKSQIGRQLEQVRTLAKLLSDSGWKPDDIAEKLNISAADLHQLLHD